MSNTFTIQFGPTLSAPIPVNNGAKLTLNNNTATLTGTDRDTSKSVVYTGSLTTSPGKATANFTSRNGAFLSTPLVFESFIIAVTEGKVMVGAFYETLGESGPNIPADDVGSYVAVEPDTDPDLQG